MTAPANHPRYAPAKILTALMFPLAMSLLALSMINVTLPSIEHGLGATHADLQWILSGYTLVFGVLLVPAGRLGDALGRKRFLILGIVVYLLASLGCGCAASPFTLKVFRLLQGLGAGLIGPQDVGIIQRHFRGRAKARAFAFLGIVVAVVLTFGPLLGGLAIWMFGPHDGWRAAFLVNVPCGVIALILCPLWLPSGECRDGYGNEDEGAATRADRRADRAASSEGATAPPGAATTPASSSSRTAPRRSHDRLDLDPIGSVLLALAVICVMVPFIRKTASLIWLLLAVGVVLLALWSAWESAYFRRGRTPVVSPVLFTYSSYPLGVSLSGFYFMGATATFIITSIFAQEGLHASALQASLIVLPAEVASALTALAAGRYAYARGRDVIIACQVSLLCGLLGFALVAKVMSVHPVSLWWLIAPAILFGLGLGALGPTNLTMTLDRVPAAMGGAAGGAKQTLERICTSVGIAAVTAVFFLLVGSFGWFTGYIAGVATVAVFMACSLGLGVVDRKVNGRGCHTA